jgi:cathepsin A (carboxypeptidase C)
VSKRVFDTNKNPGKGDVKINLAGVGVGNGLTNPLIQYQYFAQMAYNSSYAPARVDKATYEYMLSKTPECIEHIKACNVAGFPTLKWYVNPVATYLQPNCLPSG